MTIILSFRNDKTRILKSYWIYFKGVEPIFVRRKAHPKGNETKEVGLFYPLNRMIVRLAVWKEGRDLIAAGFVPMKCEGCGMGWVGYALENPNRGKRNTWFVCKFCVKVYDVKRTARKIPLRKRDANLEPKETGKDERVHKIVGKDLQRDPRRPT